VSATAISPFQSQRAGGAIEALLDLAILQANAQSAYVYRFDRGGGHSELAAFAGAEIGSVRSGPAVDRQSGAAALHWNRKTPLVLQSHAAADWRFTGFPEFQSGRFQGVVSIPLLDSGETVGVANFCRTSDASWSGPALAFLMSLSLPLGALLSAASLREQLQKANRDLAGRKLVERAKGLLQAHFQCSEEESYLRIRRLSRRRRTPMWEVARELIESGTEHLGEALARDE
jgi:GAF domain-containing protein